MKAPPFTYHAPRSLDEAVALLSGLENPKLLAGGQSLMPMMNFRVVAPDHLIDLNRIDELRGIRLGDAGLSIGAMTTQRTIEHSDVVARHCPLLIEALDHVGHQATRNRGTIGGSLCHLDPAAELPLVCQVLEPVLTCVGPRGVRQIPFTEFPVDHLTTQLEADEVLARIDFPLADGRVATALEEFARRPADFAIVAVAVRIAFAGDGLVRDARIAIGGIARVPVRASQAEQGLAGQPWTAALVEAAAEAAADQPIEGDRNNPAEYRRHLVKVLTGRALARARAKLIGGLDG